MQEASRVRFNCTHKSQIAKTLEKLFPDSCTTGEYLGTGYYEARLLENDIVLYWKVGHEPRAGPRVIAGPPLNVGDWV